MTRKIGYIALFLLTGLIWGCGGSDSKNNNANSNQPQTPTDPDEPAFSADLFDADSARINNQYLPLIAGTSFVYEGLDEEGETERVEVSVSHQTRDIAGVEARIVVDRAFEDGELVEETFDWYAQDTAGNIWYLGEDSAEYEDGQRQSFAGSWEHDRDILMLGAKATAGILIKVSGLS